MQRMELVAPQAQRKAILEYLQRRGVVELKPCEGEDFDEGFLSANTSANIAQFEQGRACAVAALAILDDAAPIKKSLLASVAGKRALGAEAFAAQAAQAEEYLAMCYDITRQHSSIAQTRGKIARRSAQLDQLRPWEALDIPMDFQGTKHTAAFLGTVPRAWSEEALLEQLAPAAQGIVVELVSACAEQTNIFVLCHKSNASAVYQTLRGLGFAPLSNPRQRPAARQMARYTEKLTHYQTEIARAEQAIQSYAGRQPDIEFLIDYYETRKVRYEALHTLAMTDHVFVARGYIPEKFVKRITRELEGSYTVALEFSALAPDDEAPVLLENNGFVAPVESITEMFALPAAGDMDPNPVMSFFYYLFFGMMLSDAGYGLLLIIGSSLALWKLPLAKRAKNQMKLFLYCGISTVFWGALFGSWFGDIIPTIVREFLGRPGPNLSIWMNPAKQPMQLLLFSFGLGIVHLLAGVAAGGFQQWKRGNKFSAICDVAPVYLLVLGAAPLAAGFLSGVPEFLKTAGKYMALAGVVLVVLTAGRGSKGILRKLSGGLGLNGLYGIAAGYLGDIISYSRLLALGLCTGIIANVVNMLGTIPQSLPMKAVLLTVVFLVGHTLNFAINVLGASVHTNRLQFVEMFSKFYEGGGRAFAPFRMKTNYIKLKEDLLDD
jgi:V/A-type H+-transporting ATPase subunit I